MCLDETDLRSALKARRSRAGTDIWPSLAARLTAPSRHPARTDVRLAIAAVLLAALAIVFLSTPRPVDLRPSVQVRNARVGGRPADVVVLEPDQRTVIVILE